MQETGKEIEVTVNDNFPNKHVLIAALFAIQAAFGQGSLGPDLDLASLNPTFAVEVSKGIDVKAYLPKATYRLEEIMVLDVGMLVATEREYYFPKDLNFRLDIRNETGKKVSIRNIESNDGVPTFARHSSTVLRGTTRLLVGCQNRMVKDLDRAIELYNADNDISDVFKLDLYRTIPQGCIDINSSAELKISVEVFNNLVVVGNDSIAKTAVFKMRSNTLRIKVQK